MLFHIARVRHTFKRQHAQELHQTIPLEARRFEKEDLAKATAVCPQGIDIAARLRQAKSVLVI